MEEIRGAKLCLCLHHVAYMRLLCCGKLMWMHSHGLPLCQNTPENVSRWATTDMGSLRRKLESSKKWKAIPSVTVAAIKHHLLQMYTGTQYWVLLTSHRLNEIIYFLASHALQRKNRWFMLTCSSHGFDPVPQLQASLP